LKCILRQFISVPDLRKCETTLHRLARKKQKPVTLKEIQQLCKNYQMPYFETSAHTGFGVEECLYEMVSMFKNKLYHM
jgi:hypothetical protein